MDIFFELFHLIEVEDSSFLEWDFCPTKFSNVSTIDSEKWSDTRSERAYISTRWDHEWERDRLWRREFMDLDGIDGDRSFSQFEFDPVTYERICPFASDMEGTVFWWNLRGFFPKKAYELFLRSLLVWLEWYGSDWCSEIKGIGASIQSKAKMISFFLSLEFWNELCTILCRDEEESTGEWIECSSMSDFFRIQDLSRWSYHIKTRHSDGLVYEIEHGYRR